MAFLALIAALALGACSTTAPEGIVAVTPFDLDRYLGKWYEIARMDHSFERGLSNVSASYRLQMDDSVEVINRGYDDEKKEYRQAKGRALFTGDSHRASLKVSFFGPFYGGYHVVALGPNYGWALVVGPDRDYVWILAREKQLAPAVRTQIAAHATALGIATEKLIWVAQTRDDN